MLYYQYLKQEIKKNIKLDGVNIFYFLSIIIFPILNFIQWYFNFKIFPIEVMYSINIKTPKSLFIYLFICFVALTIYNACVQSSWRIGFERFQGTLSSILMSPINKMIWMYYRSISITITNSWFYGILYFCTIIFLNGISLSNISRTIFSFLIIIFNSVFFEAFLLSIFMNVRNGSFLFSLFGNLQEAFSGVKVPLEKNPLSIQVVGTIIPLTYTVLCLRSIYFDELLNIKLIFSCLSMNVLLFVISYINITFGLKYLYKTGSFELY